MLKNSLCLRVIPVFLITIFSFTGCVKIGVESPGPVENTDIQLSSPENALYKDLTAKPDIIVNSTSDVMDFSYPQNVSDLPGPDGLVTLREALIAANCTSGAQLVAFNIPKNDGGFDGKVFTINQELCCRSFMITAL